MRIGRKLTTKCWVCFIDWLGDWRYEKHGTGTRLLEYMQPQAGARHEWTLEAVASTRLFGALSSIAPSRVGDVPRIKEILLRCDASLGVNFESIYDP